MNFISLASGSVSTYSWIIYSSLKEGLILVVSKKEPELELRDLFLDFLKAIAKKAKAEFGSNPKRFQQSKWMVKTGPSRRSSKVFKRDVFDNLSILKAYQTKWMQDSFPEKERLERSLCAYGFTDTTHPYLSLLHNWLQSPDPLAFDEHVVSDLLDEFVDAVLKNRIFTNSRFAIEGLITNSPILLQEGIIIRQITESELWDLGDINNKNQYFSPSSFLNLPDDSWKILEVKLQLDRKNLSRSYSISDIVLAAIRLESSGSFRVIDLGTETNFYSPGRMYGSLNLLQFMGGHAGTCTLDEKQIQHLQESWLNIRQIMESDKHYLRLPAQRLLEGGLRDRPEDSVLDYAIGLERLLTAGVRNELSYRFALRGATALSWEKGHTQSLYNNLKEFYNLRSFIIHGSMHTRNGTSKLISSSDARSIGEDYLRRIWWWFFENGFKEEKDGLDKGTRRIDNHILKNLSHEESCRGSRHEQEIEN